MQLEKLLHTFFQRKLPFCHKIRLKALVGAVCALIFSNRLSLTGLGRNFLNKASIRSNIKKVDRLLANRHLQKDRLAIYQSLVTKIINKCSKVCIHVDWSCICATTNLYLLRASIRMHGRSLVLYEECHSKKGENNHYIHKRFLNHLKSILPKHVFPILITDAGFRTPWFAYIRKLGWDFVGRLRNKNLVYLSKSQKWQLSGSLFPSASSVPQFLGAGLLTKDAQFPVNFILYKSRDKNRHKMTLNKRPSRASKSKRYAKANKEPWLLVTSLTASSEIAVESVSIYSTRMQIEESFRDTKCIRYGFGLNDSRTRSKERMNILLLIATLATFASWLAGLQIRQSGKASEYQTPPIKKKNCLSLVFLGREAIKKGLKLSLRQLNRLWGNLLELAGTKMVPVN